MSSSSRIWILWLMGAVVLWATACDDETAPSNACKVDQDCERGSICSILTNTCDQVACATKADCGANRACYDNTCTAVECLGDEECASWGEGYKCVDLVCRVSTGCVTRDDCKEFNQVCNVLTGQCIDAPAICKGNNDCISPLLCDKTSGKCVAELNCSADGDCASGKYCDTADETCKDGCRVGSCPAGKTCDLESRACVAGCTISGCAQLDQSCDTTTGLCVERTGKPICDSCATIGSTECGGPGDRCIALGQENVCAYLCESDDDCPTGFGCVATSTSAEAAKVCVPANNACVGCLITGCPAEEVCDPSTTTCINKVSSCSPCQNAVECGRGSLCVEFQGRTRCLPKCGTGIACPDGYRCNTTRDVCEPTSGVCSSCSKVEADCPGAFLDEGLCACVACLSDANCFSGESCAQGKGECVPGTQHCSTSDDCAGSGKPICYGALHGREGVCVECVEHSDCGGFLCDAFLCETCSCPTGYTCDPVTGKCLSPDSCAQHGDCVGIKGEEGWLCDGLSNLCYIPGFCEMDDATVAPCPQGSVCEPGALGLPVCRGCLASSGSCREEESCMPNLDFSGFCFGGI